MRGRVSREERGRADRRQPGNEQSRRGWGVQEESGALPHIEELCYVLRPRSCSNCSVLRCWTMDGLQPELCFPHLLNSSCSGVMRPRSEAVRLYALFASITVVTVALNLLVIISVSHFSQLHTPTNLLLLSLAVSDLLVGLLVMPVETVRFVETCWLLGDLMCAVSYIVGFTLTSASVGNMVLISVDRYVAICYPLHYPRTITCSRIEVSVCLLWASSLLYNALILKEHLSQPNRYNSCFGECLVVINFIPGAVDLMVTFIGPCSVIVVLYTRVFAVVVSQARAIQTHIATVGGGRGKVTAKKSERKAARTLGVVILVFLMGFCPYYAPSLAGQNISNSASSWVIVTWLLYLNSCLNPLMYAFFYPWFRNTIKFIVTLKILEKDSSRAQIL